MNFNFLYPNFLFALFAIAIPIIIHFFNFRKYKTIYFSNVKYLQNIKQENQSKNNLKHLLTLLARILAITALVFAFAQPFIPIVKNKVIEKNQIVSIYIDNSFSMESENEYGKLLEVAKNKAKSIVDAYRPATRFLLLTNDYKPEHQHFLSKEQLMEQVAKISTSPKTRKLSEIITRQIDFIKTEDRNHDSKSTLFLISDLQKSTTDLSNLKNDTTFNVNFIPVIASPINNLFIDSCWFETPARKFNQAEQLFVKIVNNAKESYTNIPIKLFINDTLKAVNSINIESNSSEIITIPYTNTGKGIQNGKIEIQDYPILYDNTFFFSYSIAQTINILSINQDNQNKYINALFQDDSYFTLTNNSENNINYSNFGSFNMIVLNGIQNLSSGLIQEAKTFVNNGGSLLFFPAIDGNIETYNALLTSLNSNTINAIDTQNTKISKINYENILFKNVFQKIDDNIDLPTIGVYYIVDKKTLASNIDLLYTQKGNAILSVVSSKKGKLYFFTTPLSGGNINLIKHPIFAPALYNICLNSIPSQQLYYTIGKEEIIELNYNNLKSDIFHVVSVDKKDDFIPLHKINEASILLNFYQDIEHANNYEVKDANTIVEGLSFNYNRNESILEYFKTDEISNLLQKYSLPNFALIDKQNQYLTQSLMQLNQGIVLWKWFILAALLFLAIEIIFLRLWK